ncbi:membrane protein FxsA [Rhizobium rhizosphaerae]|uniref:Membrane protein FxsA n=1 Tax=Xaviernesmea rhizosphaerae TaxID=1672749 RepID=A0ABX3PDR4_9HYPH|nr:FxsA family protein [Xaviernesmea rhizosphaerae]OQP86155.1 membrane protein FxsA [Xaviernesmea rhizosphaerae]
MRLLLLPLALFALPLLEIATFIYVGRHIGVGWTLLLVLVSAVSGALLLKHQGLDALKRIAAAARNGEDAGRELVHAAMIVVAGFLLILPGFLTDILGILLFLPPVRELAWKLVARRIVIVTTRTTRGPRPEGGPRRNAQIIDLDADEFSTDRPKPQDGKADDEDFRRLP